MPQDRHVLVLSAVRTAVGKYGGGLAAVPTTGPRWSCCSA